MAPKAEVIQEWADYVPAPGTSAKAGPYSFERGRMERAIQVVCNEMPAANKEAAAANAGSSAALAKKVKKDDVDFLVSLKQSFVRHFTAIHSLSLRASVVPKQRFR